MYDLIIIGSGPAGLSAAVYGKRAGLNLLVLEKNPMSGGQVLNTYEVDNYLGMPGMNGFDMGMQFRQHADKLGVEFREAEVTEIQDMGSKKIVQTDGETLETKSVILATGAVHAHLGVPGEEELAGMGVSYCATCDGAFFRGRTVAVVGGGDVALEDAIYLARTSEKVYLIHRRDELRATGHDLEQLRGLPNVRFLLKETVTTIERSAEVLHLQLGSGQTLDVHGLFVAVGTVPQTELVQNQLALNEQGYIIAGEDAQTGVPGVYAAGDIRSKPLRQVITAASDGAVAASAAAAYLFAR